jgi:hypothetical protein
MLYILDPGNMRLEHSARAIRRRRRLAVTGYRSNFKNAPLRSFQGVSTGASPVRGYFGLNL